MTKKDKVVNKKPKGKAKVPPSQPSAWQDLSFVEKVLEAGRGLISGDSVIHQMYGKKK